MPSVEAIKQPPQTSTTAIGASARTTVAFAPHVIDMQQRRACRMADSRSNVRVMRARASLLFTLLVGCADSPAHSIAHSIATGELGPWTAAAPLPLARANHCSAAIGDWVLVIGGNRAEAGTFVKTDRIHAAHMHDGVLGPWQLGGNAPSAVTECAATSSGNRLYVIDGLYDHAPHDGRVFGGELDASGVVEVMNADEDLPAGTRAISTEATVRDDYLVVVDTLTPQEGDTTLTLRSHVREGAWSNHDWKIGFRGQAQYAFTDRWAYTIGGYHDPAVGAVTDVFVAPLEGGEPRATTPLPMPVAFGEAVAVDDWLFVVGGRAQVFNAPGTAHVFAAPIHDDGALGAWQTLASLPVARTNHELVLAGDYLVVTGGAAMGPGDDQVFTAQVRWELY
jgi:hypothetical protein